MIRSKTGATQWVRSVKRVCALVCAAGGIAAFSASCGPSPVPPQGFVAITVGTGSGVCADPGQVWSAGTSEKTVAAGSQMVSSVACTVSSSGTSFSVSANMQFTDPSPYGDSLVQIQGTLTNDLTATQTGIIVQLNNQSGNNFENDCTVNFMPTSAEPSAMGCSGSTCMGVYPGRVWGNINCPTLMNVNGTAGSVCAVVNGEFKFEDCGE